MNVREPKREIRIIGFDDSPFEKFNNKKNTVVIGVITRGGLYFEGLLSTKVRVDGFNSTKKIVEAINKSKFKTQLQAVMIDGISLGGFNIIDVEEFYKKTNIPILLIMRREPNFKEFFKAIKHTTRPKLRRQLAEKAGKVNKVYVKNSNVKGFVYYQRFGCENEFAEKVIRLATTRSLVPEPLRIAHLIASGIKEGESRGRA